MKNEKILLILAFFIFASIFIQNVLAEDLNMKTCLFYTRNNSFSLKHFEIYVGKISPEYEPEASKYVLKILDYSNEVLFTKNLVISFFNTITNTIQDTGETCYELPYYEKINKLKIFYDNKEIFSVDLKNYICNKNSVCDLGENQYNCLEDCKIKEGINFWFYVYAAIAIIATITLLFLLRLKQQQSFANLSQKWK